MFVREQTLQPMHRADSSPDTGKTPTTVLSTVADVEALLASARSFFGIEKQRHVVLRVPDLPARDSLVVETRLNEWAHDCGCRAGALLTSLALASYLVFLFVTAGSVRHWRLGDALRGALVCLAAALVGKVVGLALARIRFVKELRLLRARIHA